VVPNKGEPELIVIFKSELRVTALDEGLSSLVANVSPVQDTLNRHGASLKLLFGPSEDRVRSQQDDLPMRALRSASDSSETPQAQQLPDLASFYRVNAPVDKLDQLATELIAHDHVEAAYVKPPGAPPIFLQDMKPLRLAPSVTPNFISRQTYLGAAPEGIDANYAQNMVGGQGEGIWIIDCEWGWRFTHEDLRENQGGVIAGTNGLNDIGSANHGTAVAGIIGGDRNPYGVTGIAPRALFSASSFVGQGTAEAIKTGADRLRAGDILLLEIHRAGPNSPTPLQGQLGFIAIEWWPDDFAAIQYAVAKGIIVVEAAGNGYQNLDDEKYDIPYSGFPASWTNPFNPANPSSGAIVVGAGAPPPGTHGHYWGPDRSRCDFSNYGARVDCQGWGREVTTTGYGDLQGGGLDVQYTDQFSGTSSASPMIVGALAAVQGVLKDFGRQLLSAARAQALLRSTGSPQQDGPGAPATQRIGNRPNLKKLIPAALNV
jgi:Subtilase family